MILSEMPASPMFSLAQSTPRPAVAGRGSRMKMDYLCFFLESFRPNARRVSARVSSRFPAICF